jgi:hypothetical protein
MNAELVELNEKEYENFLNEIYEDVNICEYNMSQGTILKKCDPIAFNTRLNNYNASNKEWRCTECESIYDYEEDANECCNEEK